MEPAPSSVIYTIYSKVISLERRYKRVHVSDIGADAIFEKQDLGWFVHLAGSWEALYLGEEKPDFIVGDQVKISITKEPNAQPSKPSV